MLSQEVAAALNTELTTDPETLGYTGDVATDFGILIQQRSFDPQQWLNPNVSPRAMAGILIGRGSWADVADAITTNTKARHFHEAAHLEVTVPYDKAETIIIGLVTDAILDSADALALQVAFRPEKTYTRAEELGLGNITQEDVQQALDYTP